ncbi:MAG: hypothetical protein RL325_1803 [Planctomycetota bacterium]
MSRLKVTAILVLLTLAAHLGCLSAGWIWDDDSYITGNTVVQSNDGVLTLWRPGATPQYYPLVFLSFWIEYSIVGLDPWLYHFNNLVLHGAGVVLLWLVLARLGVRHAAWIAALFAVHPMGVESVAWVTERKNLLSLAFALGSIYAHLRALDAPRHRVVGLHVASFALYVCALLAKTTAVFVAPALVLIALHRNERWSPKRAAVLAPYFAVGLALGLFTAYLERVQVGAQGSEFAMSAPDRVLLAAQNMLFYLARFIVPTEQIFIYPRHAPSVARWTDWIPLAIMLAATAACVATWRRSRAPALLLLWLCAALFPALGFIDVWPFQYSFVADHFAYAAMPAMAGMVILALSRHERFFRSVACVCIAACLPLSWIATAKYADAEALWRDTLARNPDAWIACNNLSSILVRKTAEARDPEQSAALATEALAVASRGVELRRDETSLINRSEALRLLGRIDEALADATAARGISPTFLRASWAEARLLELAGRKSDATAAYLRVADMQGDAEIARMARGDAVRLLVDAGDLPAAIMHARALVAADTTDGDAIANLGALLVASGDEAGGRSEFLRAISSPVRFSSEQVFVATTLRYLRLAISNTLEPRELAVAGDIAARVEAANPGDPSLRFIVLALEVRAGRQDARADIERIEREARASGATAFADQVAAFLASAPAPK